MRIGIDAIERRVTRMSAVLIRIVAASVVAAHQRPAIVRRAILIAAMQQIGMEEQSVAGLHFDVDQFKPLGGGRDALGVGAGLIARFSSA